MIIASGNVNMASSRSYSRNVQMQSTVFKFTLDGRQQQVDSYSAGYQYSENQNYLYDSFLPNYHNRLDAQTTDVQTGGTNSVSTADGSNERRDPFILRRTFLNIFDMLHKVKFKNGFQRDTAFQRLANESSNVFSVTSSQTPQIWNQVEVSSVFMEEKETTAFCSTGTVVTQDGREISFDITMEMSRSFRESAEYLEFSQYEQILTDPLIINLDSNPTSVDDVTFLFDLDCDGEKEEIQQLSEGNGYLALDKNGDGTINDGSELFGTSSGNGFKDLALYDSDKNGWIDEADSVFSQLKVWTKDENGNDVLLSLKDADVGAIYLGHAQTEFSLTDEENQLQGQVRSSGIYLKESGGVGTVQQVDF